MICIPVPGPGGRNLEFWSDGGGSTDIVNSNFTIRDSGTSLLPDSMAIASGTGPDWHVIA
jgi:hypothetical protein